MTQRHSNIPDKTTGDTLSAAEFNELKSCLAENATDAENRLGLMEQGSTNSTPLQNASYTKQELPISGSSGQNALVTDGTINGTPTMAYFYEGKWHRVSDDSVIKNQTIDIYLLAGQSNAHGHAIVATLDTAQLSQDGLFYTSWHNNTSNASTQQYYSDWASSLVAGNTRGSGTTLGNSTMFGPEIGFVARANELDLTDGKPIGVLKYAVGASSLVDNPNDTSGGLSDWDITATGDKRGDCLRGFKLAVADGLNKLTSAGYTYRLAGLVWWQGESGATSQDLTDFISHIRSWLNDNYTLDMPANQFPTVITRAAGFWGTHLSDVSNADDFIGIVDTMELARPAGASRTQVHPGSYETFDATQQDVDAGVASSVGEQIGLPDFNNDGENDMYAIGKAHADQMQLAIGGNAKSTLWGPESINTVLWLDMDDQTTFTESNGIVTDIEDKSGNNNNFQASLNSTVTAIDLEQNDKNVLRFDNNEDYIEANGVNLSLNTRHKWYFVLRTTNIDNSLDNWVSVTKSGQQFILMGLAGSTFKGNWYVMKGNNITTSTTDLNNEFNILSVEFDIPNQKSSTWLNGEPVTVESGLDGAEFGAMSIKFNKYQQTGDSDWGEAIFTENVSQANSDKIEGYLAHKWGLTDNLPTNHPYKVTHP